MDTEIKGLLARDTTNWKAEFLAGVNENGCGVMWKDVISYMDDVLPKLRALLDSKGYFSFYNIADNYTDYEWTIVDFATASTYPKVVEAWRSKNPFWFSETFDEYKAEKQYAKVAFLVSKARKIPENEKIHIDNFIHYREKTASRKNVIAYTHIITKSGKKAMEELDSITTLLKTKKNIILQGAPGTGKTYTTALLALSVLNVTDVNYSDRCSVMKKYNELKQQGQIFFTTFHQSMDYEEFVEGLRPEVVKDDDGKTNGITYVVKDGIFKCACNAVKLEGINEADCVEKFIQSVSGEVNAKEIDTISGKSRLKVWYTKGNKTLSVRSVYSSSDNGTAPLNIEKLKRQALGEDMEYNWPQYAKAVIRAAIEKFSPKKSRSVVLIIDEINRGNISKILGELITLLEADKRKENTNALTVTLPYSGELFSVPSDLYIIGTMNTTDRSTGSVDYAIRRRFAFVTLRAKKELITDPEAKTLFKAVEKFITPVDPSICMDDLMVGHSYFMTKDLETAWTYEIYPLLLEYYKDGLIKHSPVDYRDMSEFVKKFGV